MLATKGFVEDYDRGPYDRRYPSLPKEADLLLNRLKLDGFDVPPPGQGCMDLLLSKEERDRVADWWQTKGNPQIRSRWVAICVGAKYSSKLWPCERYAEVVLRLIKRYKIFPVIIGGRQEREVGEKLIEMVGGGFCAAGEFSVRESAALMEGALFYLGNDTGTMHLAAAVGIPCVAIFSSRDWPGIWEPYGAGHEVLRHDVPCSYCRLEVCDNQLQCLTGIQIDSVFQACGRVLVKRRYSNSTDL